MAARSDGVDGGGGGGGGSGGGGGYKEVQYATADQTLLAMQRTSTAAAAPASYAVYDNADHAVSSDDGTGVARYDAVEPRSGVVVYGMDDGGVGSTAVYDTPPASSAAPRPVYAVPSRAPSASSKGKKPPRGRSGSDSHAVRLTHRVAAAITDQGPAARPLYQAFDRSASTTRQTHGRMPGSEYAVLSRDSGRRWSTA